MTDPQDSTKTRHLNLERTELPVRSRRGTGPLDYSLPWVVELRLIGTAELLPIKIEERMVVGRGDKARGVYPDVDLARFDALQNGVSRQHAVLSALNSRVTVCDLGSSNGSFLNGGRLEPGKEYRLQHGDQIAFGRLAFQVHFVMTPINHERDAGGITEFTIPIIGTGQTVLLVDDDYHFLQTTAEIIKKAGFNVHMAGSVTEASTYLDHKIPDVMVIEIVLSDRDGLDLVEYLRRQPRTEHLPIIVVTSATGGYQKGRAEETGVDVFLTKPVGIDELMQGFGRVLTKINKQKE